MNRMGGGGTEAASTMYGQQPTQPSAGMMQGMNYQQMASQGMSPQFEDFFVGAL